MKTRSIFLLLVLVMIVPSKSNAQSWIIRRAIDRKIEHKVDSAVDKSDKDEAKARQQASKNDTTKTSGTQKTGTKETGRGLFGGKIDIKYEDEYKFTGNNKSGSVFTVQLSGLAPSTTFYIRAYATTGTNTIYGNELSFTTSSGK